jgi:hypothetical protein
MFEVMPMLMGKELALKGIEMEKIAVFDGVCTHLSSPFTPSTLSLPSLSPVLLLMSMRRRRQQ